MKLISCFILFLFSASSYSNSVHTYNSKSKLKRDYFINMQQNQNAQSSHGKVSLPFDENSSTFFSYLEHLMCGDYYGSHNCFAISYDRRIGGPGLIHLTNNESIGNWVENETVSSYFYSDADSYEITFAGCDTTGQNCMIVAPSKGDIDEDYDNDERFARLTTADGGKTWSKSNFKLKIPQEGYISFEKMQCSKNLDVCRLFVVEHSTYDVSYFPQMVSYLSKDKGETWGTEHTIPLALGHNSELSLQQNCDNKGDACVIHFDSEVTLQNKTIRDRRIYRINENQEWSLVSEDGALSKIPNSISCDDSLVNCHAIKADNNQIVLSLDGGVTWENSHPLPMPEGAKQVDIEALTCNHHENHCVAVGKAISLQNELILVSYFSKDNGSSWSISEVPPVLPSKMKVKGNNDPSYIFNGLNEVQCDDELGEFCTTIGNYEDFYRRGVVYQSNDAGRSWYPSYMGASNS